ncbi:MAG: DedA family protein [Roseburia sp.]|nr:DedA family protein [Roseburia sp.]
MNVETIMQYFADYGAIAIFVIVLLEYLNLPGFPAGVIMPLAGIWASRGGLNFPVTMVITVSAGLLGSIILYGLGRGGGELFLKWYYRRFPKQRQTIEERMDWLREKGSAGVFVSKLIPMMRTLISIPAGVIRMNFGNYVVSSALGVAVWNLVFVGAGYLFGDRVLALLL